MSITRIVDAIKFAERVYEEGEAVNVDDLDLSTISIDDAITLHRSAVRLRKAALQVEKATATQLADALGEGGAVRYGDTFYKYSRGWTEKVNDPDQFWAMVRTLDVRPADLFNPNDARKGKMPDVLRDTAYTKTRDEQPKLAAVSKDYAPAWMEALEDGDFVEGKH